MADHNLRNPGGRGCVAPQCDRSVAPRPV